MTQLRAEPVGADDVGPAALQLVRGGIVRVLEDERAEAVDLVEDAVAVEVDDVIGPARLERRAQPVAEGGKGGRVRIS
jgi:hypothetical protein